MSERPFVLEAMDTDNSHINNGSLHRRGPARCCSPAPSSEHMNSDRSIGLPCNFNGEVHHPDDSCYGSMESDFSMDIPTNFKGGPLRGDSDSSCLLTAADHVRCFACPSILRQPAVSVPCSYCKRCVDDTRPAGDCVCPRCDEVLNWRLQAGGGGGPPACDVCSGETRPAIKTCVTCNASYCEDHIRHHYTVPALQRHTLTPVNYDTLQYVQRNNTDCVALGTQSFR